MSERKTLLSIHDVWPKTLPQVEELIVLIRQHHPDAPIGLLVSVDAEWNEASISKLHALSEDPGLFLCGHGGTHRAPETKTLYHKIHSALISRNAAEHLSRPVEDLIQLVQHCYKWFGENGFESPSLYVPPAWAMGKLKKKHWNALPFRYYETLFGIYDREGKTFYPLGVKGYEADTAWRSFALRASNGVNQNLPFPLRIAIHPNDPYLRLEEELDADLQSAGPFGTPDDLSL